MRKRLSLRSVPQLQLNAAVGAPPPRNRHTKLSLSHRPALNGRVRMVRVSSQAALRAAAAERSRGKPRSLHRSRAALITRGGGLFKNLLEFRTRKPFSTAVTRE